MQRDMNSRILREAMAERARRHGLTVDLERARRLNSYLYEHKPPTGDSNVLYVGVGHGHDALLALLDGMAGRIVGVDPYLEGHGNNEADADGIQVLLSRLEFEERFTLHRETIEAYLSRHHPPHLRFDRIVCADVLHHIFESREILHKTRLFEEASRLCGDLRAVTGSEGKLAVTDVQRWGVRPLVSRLGLSGGWIDYRTKQSWREWTRAAEEGGWELLWVRNYVPYSFRKLARLLSGPVGRATLCDRYVLTFANGSGSA
jgi:hypothetical protein